MISYTTRVDNCCVPVRKLLGRCCERRVAGFEYRVLVVTFHGQLWGQGNGDKCVSIVLALIALNVPQISNGIDDCGIVLAMN